MQISSVRITKHVLAQLRAQMLEHRRLKVRFLRVYQRKTKQLHRPCLSAYVPSCFMLTFMHKCICSTSASCSIDKQFGSLCTRQRLFLLILSGTAITKSTFFEHCHWKLPVNCIGISVSLPALRKHCHTDVLKGMPVITSEETSHFY